MRRFSETRRPHPLAHDRSAIEGIREERKTLARIREMADHVVDTSEMTVHELRQAFTGVAAGRAPGNQLVVTILSFGFKNGIPVRPRPALRRPLPAEPALRARAAAADRS